MKVVLTVLAGLMLAISIGIIMTRSSTGKADQTPAEGLSKTAPVPEVPVTRTTRREISQPVQAPAVVESVSAQVEAQKREAPSPGTMAVGQAVETLLNASSSFQQKQSAWVRLRESGKLDEAIKSLD